MLKSVVLCILLWHEMCELSSHALVSLTDTPTPSFSAYASPKINDTILQTEPRVIYNFNASHQTIYVNGPLFGTLGFRRDVDSIDYSPRADYVMTNGIGAHKLHRRALTWGKASRICFHEGGHLAVIRSEAEERIVLKMMSDLSVADAWVGYHDQFDEGDWISMFEEPLDESGWQRWSKKWTPNPDNNGGRQDCARLLRDGGGMDDEDCDTARMFICKI